MPFLLLLTFWFHGFLCMFAFFTFYAPHAFLTHRTFLASFTSISTNAMFLGILMPHSIDFRAALVSFVVLTYQSFFEFLFTLLTSWSWFHLRFLIFSVSCFACFSCFLFLLHIPPVSLFSLLFIPHYQSCFSYFYCLSYVSYRTSYSWFTCFCYQSYFIFCFSYVCFLARFFIFLVLFSTIYLRFFPYPCLLISSNIWLATSPAVC